MMRSGIFLAAAASAALSASAWIITIGAATASGDADREIRALEIAHNSAIARGDVSRVDDLTSDDFTLITPRGFLFNKREMLRGLADGAFSYEYRQIYDLKIRVYGDAAVVTGRSVHTVQEKGRDCSDANRYTRVYVREQGRWRVVAWQTTREDREDSLKCRSAEGRAYPPLYRFPEASAAAVPFFWPSDAASQPPPSAWMSATLAVRRFCRIVSRLWASPSATVCAVTTVV